MLKDKTVTVLGSTGSVGTQALDVIRESGYRVKVLSGHRNIILLAEQVREFSPEAVVCADEHCAAELSELTDNKTEILCGSDSLCDLLNENPADVTVHAIAGLAGIKSALAASNTATRLAMANKEAIICAGDIIFRNLKNNGGSLIPVDSEHSAIFQSLNGERQNKISRILLTASGGPFRGKTLEEMKNIQVEDALKHPNWAMGRKITIDSSTMVNKGLEVMEAKWLFDVDIDDVQVVVQPQSVIHSMVEFVDGAVIAQLGTPDMKLPIQYALYYPERRYLPGDRVDFWKIGHLDFEEPDMDTFYGLELAYEAGRTGGTLPTVFNAANELAVSQFLNREIKYLEIIEIIEDCMRAHKTIENPTVEQILETEAATYERIRSRR